MIGGCGAPTQKPGRCEQHIYESDWCVVCVDCVANPWRL